MKNFNKWIVVPFCSVQKPQNMPQDKLASIVSNPKLSTNLKSQLYNQELTKSLNNQPQEQIERFNNVVSRSAIDDQHDPNFDGVPIPGLQGSVQNHVNEIDMLADQSLNTTTNRTANARNPIMLTPFPRYLAPQAPVQSPLIATQANNDDDDDDAVNVSYLYHEPMSFLTKPPQGEKRKTDNQDITGLNLEDSETADQTLNKSYNLRQGFPVRVSEKYVTLRRKINKRLKKSSNHAFAQPVTAPIQLPLSFVQNQVDHIQKETNKKGKNKRFTPYSNR